MGTSEGLVRLYDIRSSKYVTQKRHPYMLPINTIELHNEKVITADKKQIRISDKSDFSKVVMNFEPLHDINQVVCFQDSGLLLAANEF